jgi:hypothetical protein
MYRYEIWLSLAIKIMALQHPTPLGCSLPHHTHKICTSKRNWPSSWPCLCLAWRAAAQCGSKNNSGNWRFRMFVVRWVRVVGRSLLAYSRSKKSPTENCILGRRLIKNWLTDIHRPLERQIRRRDERRNEQTHGTEQRPLSDCFHKTFSERL